MRANRATTAATPSPTFTHATTCTVPRSSPLLSSSCTPFYPRSQQQLYHPHSGYAGPHDGGCQASVQHSDDVDASQSHFASWSHVRDSKFYDQQYYAAEPYEVSWAPNGGTVWDGGAWQQWGDPVEYAYAEDDTGDSANLFSDSLSYYAESPTLEQDISLCTASNTTSVPALLSNKNTQFLNCHVNEGSEADLKTLSSITGSTAMPNVFYSVIMPEQASCASKKLKESSLSSFREWKEKAVSGYGQDPVKGERKEVANAFTGSKLDMNASSSQVALHMSSGFGSQAGEFKLAADLVENARAQKEGNMLLKASYNLSKEHVSSDAIDAKHTISVTSDAIESIDDLNLKSYTLSLATDINQKDFQSKKSVSHHTSMQSSNDLCQSMASPKPATSQALDEMNDYEGLHQEKTNSHFIHPEDVGLCSNGPHLLVECIHNLSKVLLSSQSKTSINALNASDCLVLESTICMLSHRLFQCSAIEANSCQDPNCQQEPKNSNESTKGFVEPGSLQKASSQFASMQHIFSFERDGVLQNAPKLTAIRSMGGDNQNSNLTNQLQVAQEELRVLRGEVQKLQEELAYERAESNATLSIYKDLWSEAQEALKVARSEIKEISTELAVLKQELTNLKLSGGANKECRNDDNRTSFKQVENSNMVTSSSQGVMASDLSRASTEERNNTCCGSSKKDSEVLTGYFDLNCSNTGTSFTKFEKAESKHSDQATPAKHSIKSCEPSSLNHRIKSSLNHTIAAPRKLENDVAQRLSLLLSRQCLDLNETCTESCMEWSSGSHTILEPSSNVPKEVGAMPPNKNYLVWSEISCLVNDNNESGCSISNLSCQRKHVSAEEDEEDGLYDLMERESNDGGMYSAELNEGVCQEDEIEIICFKPGIADNNFTCLKGEPEWEDVVVTALDDHRSTREELV